VPNVSPNLQPVVGPGFLVEWGGLALLDGADLQVDGSLVLLGNACLDAQCTDDTALLFSGSSSIASSALTNRVWSNSNGTLRLGSNSNRSTAGKVVAMSTLALLCGFVYIPLNVTVKGPVVAGGFIRMEGFGTLDLSESAFSCLPSGAPLPWPPFLTGSGPAGLQIQNFQSVIVGSAGAHVLSFVSAIVCLFLIFYFNFTTSLQWISPTALSAYTMTPAI
jgi:hypothetical protein